jgi:hypothetical protein
MDMDIQHGQGHAAWTWTCSKNMNMQQEHEHGQAACTCPCCMSMSILFVHLHASYTCPCYCTCPSSCCTLIKMKKRNFFSKEFFTINKEIFPYCQGIICLPYPWGIIYLKEGLPYNLGNISLIWVKLTKYFPYLGENFPEEKSKFSLPPR